MIALPFVAGAVHETVTLPSPAVTVGAAGFAGSPYGTTAAEGVDVGPVPREFWARTLNSYDVPFVSVVMVHDVVGAVTVHVYVPVVEVTV